ncbi:MAG: hypothetical protein LBB61_06480 [Treponema sp.]|jgi:hypothetical protein|nr:hypothetical protein [Treponema sp.]
MFIFCTITPPVCRAQTPPASIFSLDLGYTLTGLTNNGWGLGVSYEQKIWDYLSVKGGFGHMTFLTSREDVYCTSVHISLFTNYYPFRGGIDKLYIGIGSGADFMNYFGDGELPDNSADNVIHITLILGWKFLVWKHVMIDVSGGYKFIAVDAQNYKTILDYIHPGVHFGIGIKIFL